MDRESFINKYAQFDTPDIADRIAKCINDFITYDGIENLPWKELHGRHTGHLDISSGGFRYENDFLCPVLDMCRVDRNGVVSPDMRKINSCLENWRSFYYDISDEELETWSDADFEEDDDLYEFRNAAYNAELDSFLELESPSPEDMAAHEIAMEEIWKLSSSNNSFDDKEDNLASSEKIGATDKILCQPVSDEGNNSADSNFEREYDEDGFPIYTDEEIRIYEEAVDEIEKKEENLLKTCRDIFYNDSKEALYEYLNELEAYNAKIKRPDWYEDPNYISGYAIKKMRERFDVWDKENKTSFAEFVSWIRRGELGPLPEDYDGLAGPGEPGYYGDEDQED